MGQYFRIVNLDKKEWIEPDGWKLWELCANNSVRMLGFLLATNNWDGTGMTKLFFSSKQLEEIEGMLKSEGFEYNVYVVDKDENGEPYGYVVPRFKYFGRWCGDRIAVIGDYADEATNVKPDFPKWRELKEVSDWKNITAEVVKEFNFFIEVDKLKVKSCPRNISPDMMLTQDLEILNEPKICR